MAKTQQNISHRPTKCSHRRPILSCPYSKRQNTALATIRDVGVSCSQSAPNRLPSFFSLGIKARENGEKRRIEQSKPSNSRPCASDSENQIPNEARPLPEIKSGQAPTAKGSSGSCNRGIKKLRTFGKFAAYSFWSAYGDGITNRFLFSKNGIKSPPDQWGCYYGIRTFLIIHEGSTYYTFTNLIHENT